ncbi:YihY/virulence factor BrkB family protein [Hutsoniella sourekii]|uniref:YihY/virulence factor BrkB family protein n=1 Tax=Hutsoniella sourekii TaxID=87650 RepID=UPI00048548B5|nr:YihY/virulence factor BrkB family protein [Hutsoniella sourekii]
MARQAAGRLQRLRKTFKLNNQQLTFGSYAAELSFYVIWSFVPIILALANVIAVLPIDKSQIITGIQIALPDEIESIIIPLLTDYLFSTSSSVFSLSLIISLWPASNVFNTLQRVFNTIYKANRRKNALLARAFAYVFTLAVVIALIVLTFVFVFGEGVIDFLGSHLSFESIFIYSLLQQTWLITLIITFLLLVVMYHFIPNVNWPIKYSLPGSLFSFIGFNLVSQLFPLYMRFSGKGAGNNTIGVLVILIIWLYFNAMVIVVGAYINVFFHDYLEVPYWKLKQRTSHPKSYRQQSENFNPYYHSEKALSHQIRVDSQEKTILSKECQSE